ncbi:type VI secretion system baseplate subunit TssK [Sphingomonas sp.]|uniref:type VI secretion system baseplate subunit TssK n=1 Tax=Sphingomonas sp. TaxID=28214 RepID=UPI003B00F4B1
MAAERPIHWRQGLALQPHHLQIMQRATDERFARERQLAWPYPYGVVDCAVSAELLAGRRLRFDRLRVVLPDGLDVEVNANANLPEDAAVAAELAALGPGQALLVSLAVPRWDAAGPNVLDGSAERNRRYAVDTVQVRDENTNAAAKDVQVRVINARLVVGPPRGENVELVPLLRVRVVDGRPAVDPEFYPPLMVLRGWPPLRRKVDELVLEVGEARERSLAELGQGGFAFKTAPTPAQFEGALRLRTLNRYHGRLASLAAATHVSPFEVYCELRAMVGELAALQPGDDHAAAVAEYDHTDLARTFASAIAKARELLVPPITHNVDRVRFVPAGPVARATLTKEQFARAVGFYLRVHTDGDVSALADAVRMRTIQLGLPEGVNKAFSGIRLVPQLEAVPNLPPPGTGAIYYKLDWAEGVSGQIRLMIEQAEEKQLVIWADKRDVNGQMTAELFMPA